jgi:thioredoxin reductase (NADPH)
MNKLGKFIDPHTLETVDGKGVKETLTSRRFLIAVGGRPRPLGCLGEELAISSDDLFSLPEAPGKTLVVGASYVALECAGFIKGLGMDVAVMVRSILLRGFDRDMSERAGQYMEKRGVRFIRDAQPLKLESIENGKIRVFWGTTSEDFDTVIAAVGRDPDTKHLGLANAGVIMDAKTGKIPCEDEQTNVPHIYALGDVLLGRPELTPVAIHAGKLLADRLYANGIETVDYDRVCTTVFTPLEYSCVGWTEEHAKEVLGDDRLEVYHSHFIPLEWTVAHGEPNDCYLKVLVDLSNQKIVGLHYLGPNAGEVILGYGVAFRMGMTFHDLASTVGVHPTTTEEFTLVNITKRSGLNPEKTGC